MVPGDSVLNIASVGLRPVVVVLPYLAYIPPGSFDEGDKTLFIQIGNFAVQEFEIFRIRSIEIWDNMFVPGDLSRKKERASAFVVHIFGR